jgi:predicted nucleic acid-binding protein
LVVVDTSVWVDVLRGADSPTAARAIELIEDGAPVALTDISLAEELYRTARKAGITIRNTTDCLIAAPCVRTGAPLLHADADFDRLASCTPLRVFT